MKVIDLFAGVGGLSSGFRKAGYDIVLANEIDKSISDSYKKNHPDTLMINDDIKNFIPYLDELNDKVDVIIGGPPCQGFSMAGARIRKKNAFLEDPRNFLFRNYFEVVQKVEPKYFIMENVPGMLSMSNGKIIEEIENLFSDETNFKKGKYYIYKQVLCASDYGVPQDRHRLIIFGSTILFALIGCTFLIKKKINFKKAFEETKNRMIKSGEIKKATIYDAISDLNYLSSGEGDFEQDYKNKPLTEYQKERRKNSKFLFNHKATTHNKVAIDRINELKPGGRRLDLKEGKNIKSVHSGAYGRMRWEDLSKTIITRFDTPSSGVYIHPEQLRTITPREAARLQSFDDDFIFYGNKSSVIKQIGNAVPPLLAYYLANVIKDVEEGKYDE